MPEPRGERCNVVMHESHCKSLCYVLSGG
jgi:hypothetical protein